LAEYGSWEIEVGREGESQEVRTVADTEQDLTTTTWASFTVLLSSKLSVTASMSIPFTKEAYSEPEHATELDWQAVYALNTNNSFRLQGTIVTTPVGYSTNADLSYHLNL
jgi:hypothetical protein